MLIVAIEGLERSFMNRLAVIRIGLKESILNQNIFFIYLTNLEI